MFSMILTSTIATTDSMGPGLATQDFFTQDREGCSQKVEGFQRGRGKVHKVGPIQDFSLLPVRVEKYSSLLISNVWVPEQRRCTLKHFTTNSGCSF